MPDSRAIEINGDEEEDEALRMAIALSLGQDPAAVKSSGQGGDAVIDLTQEDEDGDDGNAGGGRRDSPKPVQEPAAPVQQPASTSFFSSLGLDRKKMEEERLARLGKRKASQLDDGQPSVRPIQRPRMAGSPSMPSTAAPREEAKPMEPKVAAPASTPAPCRLPFPQGVVKKTWAFGRPRQGDDIKIEEVLQKHQLQLAVLSSFQWDEEWMLSKVDLARTKLILVAFAVDEAQVRGDLVLPVIGKERRCANVWKERGDAQQRPQGQDPVLLSAYAAHGRDALQAHAAQVRQVHADCRAHGEFHVV
jgi:hypothetical protein